MGKILRKEQSGEINMSTHIIDHVTEKLGRFEQVLTKIQETYLATSVKEIKNPYLD